MSSVESTRQNPKVLCYVHKQPADFAWIVNIFNAEHTGYGTAANSIYTGRLELSSDTQFVLAVNVSTGQARILDQSQPTSAVRVVRDGRMVVVNQGGLNRAFEFPVDDGTTLGFGHEGRAPIEYFKLEWSAAIMKAVEQARFSLPATPSSFSSQQLPRGGQGNPEPEGRAGQKRIGYR